MDTQKTSLCLLDILEQHPDLKKLVPRLAELETHLRVWKSKYDSIFVSDPNISLVYIDVEEGVKFPMGIDHKLRKYLAK